MMRQTVFTVFIILGIISLLTLLTPIRFENVNVRSIVFLIALALCYPVAHYIQNKILKGLVRALPVLVLIFIIVGNIFLPFNSHFSGGWQTVWISHRKSTNPNAYVGGQWLDLGARGYARRIVKVTPLTPLFNWTVAADTTQLDNTWKRVNESYNPFQSKGG